MSQNCAALFKQAFDAIAQARNAFKQIENNHPHELNAHQRMTLVDAQRHTGYFQDWCENMAMTKENVEG